MPSKAEELAGFKEANLYSVKIKTRIKYPFFEDSRRSRSGGSPTEVEAQTAVHQ